MRRFVVTALWMLGSCTLLTGNEPFEEDNAQCVDSIDNDGDGFADCEDTDCQDNAVCDTEIPIASDDSLSGNEDVERTIEFAELLANDLDPQGGGLQINALSSVSNGVATLNANDITFTPTANFNGVASFEYTINDGLGGTDNALVTINIAPQNDAPVAQNDQASAIQDVERLIPVAELLLNDSDIDGDPLGIISVQNQTNCIALLAGNNISFLGPQGGAASFEYTINDGLGLTASAIVTVDVVESNDPPVAADDTLNTDEDTPLVLADDAVELIGNDIDPEGDPLLVVDVQSISNGVANLSGGLITFTPAANFFGVASFEYTVTDGFGNFDVGAAQITVSPINDAPSAGDDVASTQEDTAANINIAAELLDDDVDIDGDLLTFVSAQNAQNGSLSVDGNIVTFTPEIDFNGSASFEYTITDGLLFDTATVVVAVGVAGDAPTANPDNISTNEDIISVVSAATLLANDTDPDGDTLIVTDVSNPVNGSVSLLGNNISFIPGPNFNGDASFEYTISDGFFSVSSVVTVTVNPVNDAPTANNVSDTTNEEQAILLTLTGADVDGDALQFIAQSSPANGTLGAVTIVSSTTSQILYTPNPNFSGVDSFTVVSFDGGLTSAPATVTINVNNINDGPLANDDNADTDEDTQLVLSGAELTLNDFDPDSALILTTVNNPINGTVSLNAGVVTFTPTPDFNGDASFEYTVSDGVLTDVGAVSIIVNPVNDPPSAQADTFDTDEDVQLNITSVELTDNDDDIDSGSLSVVAVSNPINGSVSLNAGVVSFIPDENVDGAASFEYTLSDGAATDVGVVNINIVAVADEPDLLAGDISVEQGSTFNFDIVTSLNDLDGSETLEIVIENIPGGSLLSAGNVTGEGSGTVGAAALLSMGSRTHCVASGDFNGDGNIDLVAANESSNNISVRLGDGAGGFGAATNFVVGTGPRGVAVGQFNGDTALDVVVANSGSGNASLLLGNGTGLFSAPFNFVAGTTPTFVTVADFNRDGSSDMAVSNAGSNNVSVFLGTGGGSFGAATNFVVGSGPFSLIARDINRDNNPDIITANENSDNVSVLLGTGTGSFGAAINIAAGDGPRGVAAGDFNNDTHQDLVTVNVNAPAATRGSLLLGDGAGGFGAPLNFATGSAPSAVAAADFNGDGDLDLAVANTNTHNISVILGNGDGTLQTQVVTSVGGIFSPISIIFVDVNEDGLLDIATANANGNNVSLFRQNPGDLTVTLTESELAGLTITPPTDLIGDFVLTVTSTATEAANSSTAFIVETFVMTLQSI